MFVTEQKRVKAPRQIGWRGSAQLGVVVCECIVLYTNSMLASTSVLAYILYIILLNNKNVCKLRYVVPTIHKRGISRLEISSYGKYFPLNTYIIYLYILFIIRTFCPWLSIDILSLGQKLNWLIFIITVQFFKSESKHILDFPIAP